MRLAGDLGSSSDAAGSPDSLARALARFVRHASPWLALSLAAAATIARASAGAISPVDVIAAGLVFAAWPLLEWLIHVYILHFRPLRIGGRVFDLAVAEKHRRHHADPWSLDILFIPLRAYVLTVPTLLGISTVALSWHRALTVTATVMWLTLAYEWIHFLIHTRYRPRSSLFRRLWRNHRLHHSKNERYWMGVSRLLGDRLLGTAPAAAAVPTSATCRALPAEPRATR